MQRHHLQLAADAAVAADFTGLRGPVGPVLATPTVAVATVTVGAVGVAGAVTGVAVGTVGLVKGDEEEPTAPPQGLHGAGGHVASLLAVRGAR